MENNYAATESYNIPHLNRVMRERSRSGLFRPDSTQPVPHPMTGEKIVDLATGQVLTVSGVLRHWRVGGYYCLAIPPTQYLPWENINSTDEDTIRRIEANRKRFMVLRRSP